VGKKDQNIERRIMKKRFGLVLATVAMVATLGLALAGFVLALSNTTDQRFDRLIEQGFPVFLYEDDGINQGGRIPVPVRIKPIFVVDQSGISSEENRLTFVISREEKNQKGLFLNGTRFKIHIPDENVRPPR